MTWHYNRTKYFLWIDEWNILMKIIFLISFSPFSSISSLISIRFLMCCSSSDLSLNWFLFSLMFYWLVLNGPNCEMTLPPQTQWAFQIFTWFRFLVSNLGPKTLLKKTIKFIQLNNSVTGSSLLLCLAIGTI